MTSTANKAWRIAIAIMAAAAIISQSAAAQGFGAKTNINKNWKFTLDNPKYAGAEFHDDSNWKTINLPHDWSVEGTSSQQFASCTGYLPGGIGWYRKALDIPASDKGKKIFVYFEGVYNNSEVYINGKWIGKRPNGYVSFSYDLTPYINFGGRNVLAVSVDHRDYADSRWYTGSGIYRDVWLIRSEPVHFNLWGISCTSSLSRNKAELDITAEIVNDGGTDSNGILRCELIDRNGEKVASGTAGASLPSGCTTSTTLTLNIENPHLWDISNPYLYTLKTTIMCSGETKDENSTLIGIRDLKFNPDKGFSLNGRNMKVKGVCLHHDAGALGSAVPKEVWMRRILKLKELGCNAIRMSHNPQATALYEVCDETGMLVMDEAFDEWEYPKKKWIEGWNVGKPGFQGSSHYFREWSKKDLEAMIRRDRNHPSIFMWSIGNEVDYPNDPYSHPILDKEGISQIHEAGYKKGQPHADRLGEIAEELVAVVKEFDTSRPVTAALAGAVMSNETTYPSALDVVGYNYTEARYKSDHLKYPERVLYGSENRHDLEAWKAARDNDFIFGQFIWTGFDYLGESGPWPSRGFSSGLIDFTGEPKARGYFRKALWREDPVIYVGTCHRSTKEQNLSSSAKRVWNYNDGEEVKVVVYSNCDEVELFLNGKKYGERKRYDDNTAVFCWNLPYKNGKLTAVGYNGGKKSVEDYIMTTGQASKIDARLAGEAKAGRLLQIEIEMKDTRGETVILADNEIKCAVKGAGRLIALDSGSNDVRDNYRDNLQRCNNGKLLAYIIADEPGCIEVMLTSPLVESCTLNIEVE